MKIKFATFGKIEMIRSEMKTQKKPLKRLRNLQEIKNIQDNIKINQCEDPVNKQGPI